MITPFFYLFLGFRAQTAGPWRTILQISNP
jgi:hypothetical protein